MKDLAIYLESLLARNSPLLDLDYKKDGYLKKFEKKWEQGDFKVEKDDPLYCVPCKLKEILNEKVKNNLQKKVSLRPINQGKNI